MSIRSDLTDEQQTAAITDSQVYQSMLHTYFTPETYETDGHLQFISTPDDLIDLNLGYQVYN